MRGTVHDLAEQVFAITTREQATVEEMESNTLGDLSSNALAP